MTLEGDRITFKGDQVTFRGGGNSAFLTEIIESGIHRWRFKSDIRFCHWWCATIGIWECTNNAEPPRNEIFLLNGNRGYGLDLQGGTLMETMSEQSGTHRPSQRPYAEIGWGVNCIEMVLDLDKGELKYTINGADCGKAFDVKKGCSYRAAVNLSVIGDSVSLL